MLAAVAAGNGDATAMDLVDGAARFNTKVDQGPATHVLRDEAAEADRLVVVAILLDANSELVQHFS